jgi:hypothetical protein
MASAPVFSSQPSWASALGTFLLQFGILDYLTHVHLKNNLECAKFSKIAERHFKDRLSAVAEHIGHSGSAEMKEAFESLLPRIEPIRNLRNHIAHGYILIQENETGSFELSISLPKDLDQEDAVAAKHVTFDDLQANLKELTSVIETFKKIVGFREDARPE